MEIEEILTSFARDFNKFSTDFPLGYRFFYGYRKAQRNHY